MARVAIIERFSSKSRTCDPEHVPEGDDVHVIRLRGNGPLSPDEGPLLEFARSEAARCAALPGQCLMALGSILADRRLPRSEKRAVILSALATRGARFAALAGVPEILRLLRSQRFDRIDCYSSRGFGLVAFLSRHFGIPYREFLADGTRYFGEFAFELLTVVPYAYWLHRHGRLRITQSSADTKCLYYFSPRHEELPLGRSFVPVPEYPNGATSIVRFDRHAFPKQLDLTRWIPPPYKEIYRNEMFRWAKPLCIVCNKFTREPSVLLRRARNFISVPDLLQILKVLTPRWQVVYVRPRPNDIVNDHQAIRDLGDFEAIQKHFPEVMTIQQLHARHPALTFNELQMRLFANCERFISVLGGASYLASYFGGTNVVYAREGWEVSCSAYKNWFHLFSGARVIRAANPRELHELVRREFGS
ncbi:MAG: hypothetical protein JNN08_06295 [Bryobacterales bacterium]|nr:hypothetical protein [Bryobacterales bacterium]